MKHDKQSQRFGYIILSMLILLMASGTGLVHSTDEVLPKAEKILDGYVEATGGLAAYDKIQNRVTKGTVEMAGMGIKFSITVYNARPNKSYSLIESEAIGNMESGCDGSVVWENSAMQGAQIKEGKERSYLLKMSVFDRMAYWRKAFKEVKCTGVEDIGGKPCYKVIATPFEGEPEPYFFDKETNLLSMSEMTLESQMGTIKAQMFPSGYEKIDGILIAKNAKFIVMGMERTITMASIEHNVKLPEDRFAVPPAIQALLDKKKEEKK